MSQRFAERMRRRRIDLALRETARLIDEVGLADLRMEDVAGRVGVAKGTIYLDFGNKDALVAATLERCREDFTASLADRTDGLRNPAERLAASLRFLAEIARDAPHLRPLLLVPVTCAHAELRRAHEATRDELAGIVREAGRSGVLPDGADVDFAVEALLAVTALPSWQRLVEREGSSHAAHKLMRVLGDGEAIPHD